MKAPRWWRRWFGGNTVNPTGPASPPPALDFAFPGLPSVPPRPGTLIELLPGSLPFDPIGEAAAEWNSVPRSPDPFEIHMIPPEVSIITIDREARRRELIEQRERPVRSFHLNFARYVRDEANGNYSHMARKLGVAPSVVGRWATGRLMPSVPNLIRFCAVYGYDLSGLTGEWKPRDE